MKDTADHLQRVERPPQEQVEDYRPSHKGEHEESVMPSGRFVGFVVEADKSRNHVGQEGDATADAYDPREDSDPAWWEIK